MDRNEHFYEAAYQTWMRGGNPDRLSFDRAEQDFYNNKEPDYTAQMEINRQRKPKQDEAEEGGSVLFRQPPVVGQSEQFYCNCSRAKGLDNDEDGMPYCIECQKPVQ